MNRRIFIRTTSLAIGGLILAPNIACSSERLIGLQIYSVRNAINQDLNGTLAKLAEMGYTSIEHAGYNNGLFYGLKPTEFKNLVESFGMKLLSGHAGMSPTASDDNWKEIISANAEAGLKYLVVPSIGGQHRNSQDALKRTADGFNRMGEICNNHGLRFAYHNHAFEFEKVEGKKIYDTLLDETDPDLLTMEMDLYWTYRGNNDPLEYFEKYPGRFELWHVKDMEAGEELFFAEVGHGIIDFEKIFAAKKQAGLVYYFVEQDASRRDPMESVKMSAEFLQKTGY